MHLLSSYFVTFAFALAILLLFVKYCRNTLKLYEGYPVFHLVPYVFYRQAVGKIPKDVPFSSFLLKTMAEGCMKYMKEGLCMIYLPRPTLLIFGEEPIKIFLNEKSAQDKPVSIYGVLEEAIGPGLISKNGETWKNDRKMINPVFSRAMVKDKVSHFNEHAQAFIKDLEKLDGKQTRELIKIIKLHFFNVLNEGVFGFKKTEENKEDNLKFFHSVDRVGSATTFRFVYPWLRWKFFLKTFRYGRQILRDYKELYNFTEKTLLKMKEHITSNQTDAEYLKKSFAYILLKHHMENPSFTSEDLHGEATTFIAAGYDSAAYTMMWCLFNLGLNPDIQEKVYNEIQFVSKNNYISFEDCSDLTYLEAVIMETLRLYPTIPLFARELTQDVECGNRKVPKDTIVAFFPYVLHRNPDTFPDPEKFDPERFLGTKQNPGTYIPFSEGPRYCIGKKYAVIEVMIFLAYFLRNFKIISLDKREDMQACWDIVLTPPKPMLMQIQRR